MYTYVYISACARGAKPRAQSLSSVQETQTRRSEKKKLPGTMCLTYVSYCLKQMVSARARATPRSPIDPHPMRGKCSCCCMLCDKVHGQLLNNRN